MTSHGGRLPTKWLQTLRRRNVSLLQGKCKPCKLDNCSLELKLVESDIEKVDSQKLLRVAIDKQLSFDVHTEELCKKLCQRVAVLRKIRRFIPIEQRILYYNAMITQVILYGSTICISQPSSRLTHPSCILIAIIVCSL